jgi:ferritin-like metal-binding protein YciE
MKKTGKIMSLADLFVQKIQALYDIESEIVDALPDMVDEATDEELKTAFQEHLIETRMHVERLKEIFMMLEMKPKKLECDGIRGIIKDAKWVMKHVTGATALDANLIATAQYVEHYEMAGYETAAEWARLLGHMTAAKLLTHTLEEEIAASDKILQLALEKINREALGSDENTEEGDADV